MGNTQYKSGKLLSHVSSIEDFEDLAKARNKKIEKIMKQLEKPSENDEKYTTHLRQLETVKWTIFLVPSSDGDEVYAVLLVANDTTEQIEDIKYFINIFYTNRFGSAPKKAINKKDYVEAYLKGVMPNIHKNNKVYAIYNVDV